MAVLRVNPRRSVSPNHSPLSLCVYRWNYLLLTVRITHPSWHLFWPVFLVTWRVLSIQVVVLISNQWNHGVSPGRSIPLMLTNTSTPAHSRIIGVENKTFSSLRYVWKVHFPPPSWSLYFCNGKKIGPYLGCWLRTYSTSCRIAP